MISTQCYFSLTHNYIGIHCLKQLTDAEAIMYNLFSSGSIGFEFPCRLGKFLCPCKSLPTDFSAFAMSNWSPFLAGMHVYFV